MRAGVPVLKRRSVKPMPARAADRRLAGRSPCGPALQCASPMMTRLLRYTPAATMTAPQGMTAPVMVFTPHTAPFAVRISDASPWRTVRPACENRTLFIACW